MKQVQWILDDHHGSEVMMAFTEGDNVGSEGHLEESIDPGEIIDTVQNTTLPKSIESLAKEYSARIGIRDPFLWKWIYALFPSFTLDCVEERAFEHAREQKTMLTIFVTTLDDIAEYEKDKATFDEARKFPYSQVSVRPDAPGVDPATIGFVNRVWSAFEDRFEAAPCAGSVDDMFRYDLQQTLNAIEYSWLVSEHPTIANLEGAYQYGAHNMVMFAYADIDLAHSPSFDQADLSVVRETIWELQRLARIGNWVSTWQRELEESDISSGPVIAALSSGVLSIEDLRQAGHSRLIERIHEAGIEEEFMKEWQKSFNTIRAQNPTARSVDLNAFIDGMQTVLVYHLATRGYK